MYLITEPSTKAGFLKTYTRGNYYWTSGKGTWVSDTERRWLWDAETTTQISMKTDMEKAVAKIPAHDTSDYCLAYSFYNPSEPWIAKRCDEIDYYKSAICETECK